MDNTRTNAASPANLSIAGTPTALTPTALTPTAVAPYGHPSIARRDNVGAGHPTRLISGRSVFGVEVRATGQVSAQIVQTINAAPFMKAWAPPPRRDPL